MRGDRHSLRAPGDRRVDLLDVTKVLVFGVVTALRDHLALRRVVEIGERCVVQLEVRAAELAEASYFVGVSRAEVVPKLVDGAIHAGVDGGRSAPVMHHAGG